MAQTLTMRATSLAASTALLAFAAIAAFSLKWAVAHLPANGDPRDPIITVTEPAPPAPTHPVQHLRPNQPTTPSEQPEPVKATPISTPPTMGGAAIGDSFPPTIANAHWLQTPRNLSIYYPVMALRREIEGEVQLDCLVTTTGALQCIVASETPANWGFGAAAIRIAHDYRMVPAMRDGAPIEARYSMRVPFRLSR
jgi:periplasmic protein TonB